LRGDPENKDISRRVINQIVKQNVYANSVTFTGGEPFLHMAGIKYFLDGIHYGSFEYGNWYIVTNGTKLPRDLHYILEQLTIYGQDNEISALAISDDQFHKKARGHINYNLDCYLEMWSIKYDKRGDIFKPIGEGRWAGGEKQAKRGFKYYVDADSEEIVSEEGTIYIDVRGNVVFGCDLSYESQRREKVGNIFEETLEEIVLKHGEKEECPY